MIRQLLMDEIESSGKNILQIAREAGIKQNALYEFVRGRGLCMFHVEKLFEYFRLRVVKAAESAE